MFTHFLVLQTTAERRRRGGKRHRISGDTAGSWFQNQRFRSTKVREATVERLRRAPSWYRRDASVYGPKGCGHALHYFTPLAHPTRLWTFGYGRA